MSETNKGARHSSNKIWSFLGFLMLATAIGVILMNEFDAWSLNLGIEMAVVSLPLIFLDQIQKGWNNILETKVGRKILSVNRYFEDKLNTFYPDNRRLNPIFYIASGIFFGLLACLVFYLVFSEGVESKDFYSLFVSAMVLGVISFSLLSPLKQIHFFVLGIMVVIWGLFVISSEPYWAVGLIIAGFAMILRFFNKSVLNDVVSPFFKSKTFKTTLKVLFWGILAVLGVLVFGGVISFIVGLSATTIIIILLVLILLK